MKNTLSNYRNRLCVVFYKNATSKIGVITGSLTFVTNPQHMVDFFKTGDSLSLEQIHGDDININEIDYILFVDTNHPKKFVSHR